MPAASTRREISGHAFTSALETKRASGTTRVDRHDVEPRDVVGGEQARPARRRRRRSRSAMPSTRSILVDHQRMRSWRAVARRAGERRTGRSPGRAGRGRPRAPGERARAGAVSPRCLVRPAPAAPCRHASVRDLVGDARRRPACSARGPAARGRANGVCWLRLVSVSAPTVHASSGANTQRSASAPSRRPAALSPARAERVRASTRAGRLVTAASVRARSSLALAPHLSAEAEQQLEAGRAGLGFGERQVLGVLADRRVVADQRVDRAVGQRRRGSRRGRAAGAAAARAASRHRSSRCRRRSGAAGGC